VDKLTQLIGYKWFSFGAALTVSIPLSENVVKKNKQTVQRKGVLQTLTVMVAFSASVKKIKTKVTAILSSMINSITRILLKSFHLNGYRLLKLRVRAIL